MATGKRYYWIKLRESFMTSDTVDFLMSQKDGANYVVLYQMLCLKTINTGGRLSRTIGEIVIPYDVEKIQRDCKWFSADTIRVALNLYKRFGLIYEDMDGTLVLVEHDSMVGSETDWAQQKRDQLKGRDALPSETRGNSVESGVENFHTDIRDKDTRDKSSDTRYQDTRDTDIRDKSVDTKDNEVSCAELPDSGHSTPEPTPSGFSILLNDGTTYNVPQEDVDTYKALYPAVDVEQALRNMIGWSMTAGSNRKTKRGIKRFITNWLIRDQDNASKKGGDQRGITNETYQRAPRRVSDEKIL